ncbi:hypothetical protein [Lentilactobacillus sp. Marseille-Q4993]|uniref:hypothetical protein n=1 Tax=Lentilactobacillus sp. Marseille-Q4993 TaxID=3039492 RepID=UPI0024BC1DA6|nr:hypothetical protein [Lentilactobacillus sp. Marseille-Q4993]
MKLKKFIMIFTVVIGINLGFSSFSNLALDTEAKTTKTTKKTTKKVKKSKKSVRGKAAVTKAQFRFRGVIKFHHRKWTYYTGTRFADGTRNHGGYDKDGYVIVSAPSYIKFGTKIMTPLGWGKVHDRGTAMTKYHFDVVI